MLFTDVETVAHLVREVGCPTFIQRLVDNLEQDYSEWSKFDKSPRLAAHSDIGVIELMPIACDRLFSFKYVNGHPANTKKNLMTVMAFGVLSNVETGYPILLSELTLVTALRTAAASIVAAKRLARENSSSMALIGNGSQAEFQAIAFHKLLGINEIKCFDVDALATRKLIDNLSHFSGLRIIQCESARQAVAGTDIVTTVTADKKLATIITPDMLEPGMHINGVGGDCPGKTELHREVLSNARVFVQFEPQTRIEGDIQQLPADFPVTELWRVLTNRSDARVTNEEITVFDSVGFALEDYSALRLIYELAVDKKLGRTVSLVPNLANPKDLYSLLLPQSQSQAVNIAS